MCGYLCGCDSDWIYQEHVYYAVREWGKKSSKKKTAFVRLSLVYLILTPLFFHCNVCGFKLLFFFLVVKHLLMDEHSTSALRI